MRVNTDVSASDVTEIAKNLIGKTYYSIPLEILFILSISEITDNVKSI
jgi:hypothetical protein